MMSKNAKDAGIKKRSGKQKSNDSSKKENPHEKKSQDTKRKKSTKESSIKVLDWFFDAVSSIIGMTVMILASVKFSQYLEMLHENQLWFSNIKEIEREISFRTEQGLYYSFYKQLVNSESFADGLEALKNDSSVESGHSINILQRFNIYPEVTLAFLYKYFNLQATIPAILFYIKFIFYLNGLYIASIYITTWALCGSWIAGALSVGLYILNLSDASRVHYTVPLRESFSGPFIFAQLASLVMYLKSKKGSSRQYLCLLMNAIFTFLFTMSWQFGQFILLLQSIVLFVLHLASIMTQSQLRNVFLTNIFVMILNFVLHHGQPMILGSLVLTFIPLVLMTTNIQNVVCKNNQGVIKTLFLFIFHVCGILVFSVMLNNYLKVFLNIDADDHVFKFLKSKVFFEQSRDFDTRLYMCNHAFNYMDWDTLARLWSRLLLPIYLPVEGLLLLWLIFSCLYFWYSKKPTSKSASTSVFYLRPELSFWIVLNFVFGLLAMSTLRMKMLWTPQICVLASIGVADHNLWFIILSKLSSKTKKWLVRVICYIGCTVLIAAIVIKMVPVIDAQLEDLKEFWDPDTVELMEYIKANTSSTAVFAGSMQLLAGVKLCTSRSITNHPHFEDKWLRLRTKSIYQMYGRHTPDAIHQILKDAKATHIILEDSICLAPSRKLCRVPDIIDINNGHLPDSLRDNPMKEYADLKTVDTPRFCDEVRHLKSSYSKYFRKVFINKTFRVYRLI